MRKIVTLLLLVGLVLAASFPTIARNQRTVPAVNNVEGYVFHTMQSGWFIADSTTSAGTEPTALGEDERKKLRVDAAIAAAASGDDEISTVVISSDSNWLRFRSINVTKDSGNVVYEIYFGTLAGEDDCDLVHAGQLNFTSGDQDSSYYQIGFTSGGTYVPKVGETVTGNTSGETAEIVAVSALSSGAWADGDAAGTITYRSSSGTFTSSETVKIVDPYGVTQSNVLTHAASDLVLFEWADTLTVTSGSWGAAWDSISPADDTIAEAEIDTKGADFMVVLASTCDADAKLLVKGY
jgi:hypothetical protein